ncbi:hypothetical protein BWI93_16405 [Siphonobacter sp. BAB-5385]|uniref:TlpA family protein disulfide reductase n=1 Tax=Siphonobacter sp. BAB-5385 TaxID=1864822 RepID=UPI000B9E2DE6|nr:TlpA disulfide reductase family protein [Siphonobacter sp. BAB-5385]OZI07108.1 hypothetical protein BWI93_16405 [Siphonobacter sp. BAB-5385]
MKPLFINLFVIFHSLLLDSTFASAQGSKPFVIKGRLLNAPSQYVYFNQGNAEDSCLTDKQGYFTFRGENEEELEYRIISKIPNIRNIPLALHNQTVHLVIDGTNKNAYAPLGSIKMDGSPSSYELNYNIGVITNQFSKQFKVLINELNYLNSVGDSIAISNKQKELDKARINWFYASKKGVDKAISPVTAFNLLIIMETAMYSVPEDDQLKNDLTQSYNHARNRFSKSRLVQDLYTAFVKQNTISLTLKNINDLPFKLRNEQNDTISYEMFKGKLILVDFWASWCKPCREENPILKKAFSLYGKDNFTIVSISIDKEEQRKNWIAAIESDGIGDWTHLINDFNSAYNVIDRYVINAIPSNLLIRPDGTIVERNLRGQKLIDAIGQYLKP